MTGSNYHDRRYKRLFSHPVLLRELLESFVDEEFIHELDFTTLERLDKSFVTDRFEQKESDLIYKINFKGEEVYIYLLIEFQSTVDRFMALRMLRYICEFYEFLVQQRVKKLPPVFPVLLYNGDAQWTAQFSMKKLVNHTIPEKYIPDFYYYAILENEISKDTLLEIKNAVSAIFYIENSSIEDTRKNIQKITKLIMTEKPEVVTLFREWINNLFGYQDTEIISSIQKIEGTQEMFATALKKHDEKLKRISEQKGIKKGKKEGVLEGIEKGKIETALKMRKKNFTIQDIMDITGLSEKTLAKNGIE